MLTQKEKLEVIREKLNKISEVDGWGLVFSFDQVQNKVDALTKKAKKIYDKFSKKTATGSAVESKIDLQVSVFYRIVMHTSLSHYLSHRYFLLSTL